MKDVKDLVLPHLRSPKGYDGVRSLEAMAAEAGIPQEKIIRLNGNENSYGPSPKVAQALGSFDQYNRYPDPEQKETPRSSIRIHRHVPRHHCRRKRKRRAYRLDNQALCRPGRQDY